MALGDCWSEWEAVQPGAGQGGRPARGPPALCLGRVGGWRTKRSSPRLMRNGWPETERNVPNAEKVAMSKRARPRTSAGGLRGT